MPPIRVVLADMPRMLSDIVSTVLEAEPDVILRRAPPGDAALSLDDAAHDADVVILAEEELQLTQYARILHAHPDLRVVAISGDGRDASVHEMRPHRESLGELSSETLLRAVRARSATVGEAR